VTYEEALKSGRKTGVSRATDEEFMAMFLDGTAELLLGAVSPKLMFQGARKKGLTTKELAVLMNDHPRAARDLMWE
jgi:pyrroline-5-carboxylate reductase